MSRETQKGATFEKQVADYLREETGLDIDRRVKHGVNDTGDIHGVYISGHRVVVECKNHKKMELSTWVDEAERERENDAAVFSVVVHKRKGKGAAKLGDTYTTMTLEQFAKLVWLTNTNELF